jgi:hypothetical protein
MALAAMIAGLIARPVKLPTDRAIFSVEGNTADAASTHHWRQSGSHDATGICWRCVVREILSAIGLTDGIWFLPVLRSAAVCRFNL